MGSLLTRGTITALPVSTTLPITPFADGVLDMVRGAVQAVRRLDVKLPPILVNQHDEAADDGVAARERLEDIVNRRLRVQRARERLADLQQRGQAFVLVRGAVGRGRSGRELGRHACMQVYDKNVHLQKGCDPILTRPRAAVNP